jgi:hypothetical protein
MLAPMALLALVCLTIGVVPGLFALPLDNCLLVFPRLPAHRGLAGLVPFGWISLSGAGLLAAALLAAWLLARRARREPCAVSRTWSCGYLRPDARMQYSASSFGATLVSWFSGVLRPRQHRKEVAGLFPVPGSLASHLPETVLELICLPFLEYLYRKSAPVRHLQHGKLNIYIFYTFITLVVLLVATSR